MNVPARKALLLKSGFRCLLFANVVSVPLGLALFGCSPAQAAEGLFPLICVFLYLPARCKSLRLDMDNFFEYLEEE